mmetsp:Transcript_110573/g.195841  ORF Transcript_110573/g.195841 Transcript_110573/m.195841 type:complete len:415 (-) Transcript_110573:122-1366(-)
MHVLSHSAMWLKMRLVAAAAILLCHTGVEGQTASCQLPQGTTPMWSTAERCSRGIALLAVQWRRSLVVDDQATENVTQESFTPGLGAPLGTQLGVHGNSSIGPSLGAPLGTEFGMHGNASMETTLGTPLGTEFVVHGNASMDVTVAEALHWSLSNESWMLPTNFTGPPVVATPRDDTEIGVGRSVPSSVVTPKNETEIGVGRESTWRMAQSSPNGSDNPQGKEQFEPFGYPGAGLLLELHMPQVTLRELHSASHGSLASFLLELRGELSKAADVDEPRISILGIYGRFKRLDGVGEGFLEHVGRQASSSPPAATHVDEEVIVRFEVLPGWGEDAEPREVLDILRNELRRPNSGISSGPLGTKLENATLTLSAPVGLGSLPRAHEQRGMAHMSAMAWPIGISAAFIGVLIWLAAY